MAADVDGGRQLHRRARARAGILVVAGGVAGLVVGAIAALNIAIFFGPDQGYESSIVDLFESNVLVGLLAVAAMVAGPVVGIVIAMRSNRRRQATDE